MKKLSLFLLVLVFCVGCATMGSVDTREVMKDQFNQGKQAYEDGNYSKAFGLLKPAAEAGNPNAQYFLAIMYDFGRGVKTDHETANAWYLKAAEQGNDDAQYNLAISYKIGEGIEEDQNKAVYWLSKAVANGDEDAMHVLTNDYAKSSQYPEAQYALAQVYRNGVKLHNDEIKYPNEGDNSELAPDMAKYKYWLEKAAGNGHAAAAQELSNLK